MCCSSIYIHRTYRICIMWSNYLLFCGRPTIVCVSKINIYHVVCVYRRSVFSTQHVYVFMYGSDIIVPYDHYNKYTMSYTNNYVDNNYVYAARRSKNIYIVAIRAARRLKINCCVSLALEVPKVSIISSPVRHRRTIPHES